MLQSDDPARSVREELSSLGTLSELTPLQSESARNWMMLNVGKREPPLFLRASLPLVLFAITAGYLGWAVNAAAALYP
jgi:hypothetical protein